MDDPLNQAGLDKDLNAEKDPEAMAKARKDMGPDGYEDYQTRHYWHCFQTCFLARDVGNQAQSVLLPEWKQYYHFLKLCLVFYFCLESVHIQSGLNTNH